jgi:Na+-driven multidrug efflux pump
MLPKKGASSQLCISRLCLARCSKRETLSAAAPNVTVTLQTALLGSYGGSDMQAGFGAVATTANTVCFLFNFLTDGVSAKLGKNAGAADWASLRKHVKLALIWYNLFPACALHPGIYKPEYRPYLAMEYVLTSTRMKQVACSGLAGGALACSTLAVLKHPITLLLNLQPEVLRGATPYWWVRVAITPLVLVNMSISGILQVGVSVHMLEGLVVVWIALAFCHQAMPVQECIH